MQDKLPKLNCFDSEIFKSRHKQLDAIQENLAKIELRIEDIAAICSRGTLNTRHIEHARQYLVAAFDGLCAQVDAVKHVETQKTDL